MNWKRGLVGFAAILALAAALTAWVLGRTLASEGAARYEVLAFTDEQLGGEFVAEDSRLSFSTDGTCLELLPENTCVYDDYPEDESGVWVRTERGLRLTFDDRVRELESARLGEDLVLTGHGKVWRWREGGAR